MVAGTLNALSPNIETFIVLRFLIGTTFPALYQIPFIVSRLSRVDP